MPQLYLNERDVLDFIEGFNAGDESESFLEDPEGNPASYPAFFERYGDGSKIEVIEHPDTHQEYLAREGIRGSERWKRLLIIDGEAGESQVEGHRRVTPLLDSFGAQADAARAYNYLQVLTDHRFLFTNHHPWEGPAPVVQGLADKPRYIALNDGMKLVAESRGIENIPNIFAGVAEWSTWQCQLELPEGHGGYFSELGRLIADEFTHNSRSLANVAGGRFDPKGYDPERDQKAWHAALLLNRGPNPNLIFGSVEEMWTYWRRRERLIYFNDQTGEYKADKRRPVDDEEIVRRALEGTVWLKVRHSPAREDGTGGKRGKRATIELRCGWPSMKPEDVEWVLEHQIIPGLKNAVREYLTLIRRPQIAVASG